MKLLFTYILLITFTLLISGLSLKAHYCAGRLVSIHFSIGANDYLCRCGSKTMKKGCCENRTIGFLYGMDQEHVFMINNFDQQQTIKNLLVPFILSNIFIPASNQNENDEILQLTPLLALSKSSHVVNCVFKI